MLRERLRSTGIVARRRQSGGLAILIPSHATLRKFRSAGLEAVKRTRLGVCFRDILRLYSPFLVADASARQRAKYNQQECLCHRTTLPLTQLLEISAIFVSEMWIQELNFKRPVTFGRSLVSIGTAMRLKEFDSNGMGANDGGWSATGGSRPIAAGRITARSICPWGVVAPGSTIC